MKRIIIAMTGSIGAGKTTIANALKEDLPNTVIVPVAYHVYAAAECVYDYLALEFEKDRALLQAIGDIGRSVDEDFWISNTVATILKPRRDKSTHYYIVPDIRYPNEIAYLKAKFETVIHIKLEGTHTAETSNHSSETSMNDYNNYTKIIDGSQTVTAIVGEIKDLINQTMQTLKSK